MNGSWRPLGGKKKITGESRERREEETHQVD